MKTKSLSLCLLFVLMAVQRVAAQLPVASTADAPVWYYIRVQGSDDGRAARVWTAEGTETVSGRELADVADEESVYPQLWRFEKEGDSYIITNRATGKQVDVAYDAQRDISVAVLRNKATARFSLIASGNTFQIRSSVAPEGGIATEVYMHQANSGGSRDYVIMLVGTDYSSGVNSAFTFEMFEDFGVEYSTASAPVWYRIESAKGGTGGKCIAENPLALPAEPPLLVNAVDEKDYSQQWRVQRQNRVLGTVALVNRASGRFILTGSVEEGLYNLTQLGAAMTDGRGWVLTYLGRAQYALSGKDSDGIVRYLNASVEGQEPEVWDEERLSDSGFAWKFKKVSTVDAIENVSADALQVRVENGRVVVEGVDEFLIVTPDGIVLPAHSVLKPGVYIVKAAGLTKSIVIH